MFPLRLTFQQFYARFDGCMKTLWQLEQGGGQTVKTSELPTRTQHNIFSHLVMVSTLIFSTFFGTN